MFFHHSTAHAEAKVDVAYEISVLEVGGVTCMRTTNWFVLFLDIDVAYEKSVLEVGGVTCIKTTNWFVLFLDIHKTL